MSEFTFQKTTSLSECTITHSFAHIHKQRWKVSKRGQERKEAKKYGDESQKICHMSVFWLAEEIKW